MLLINIKSGKKLNGIIEKMNKSDFKSLQNSEAFTFDWSIESNKEVYKIRQKGKNKILGLMSLIDIPQEFRIHINLIESNKNERGQNKKIGNIPNCLIAFACREAFKKGYVGFVSLVPKTALIPYYKKYGFLEVGFQMAIWNEESRSLIVKYLEDEEL